MKRTPLAILMTLALAACTGTVDGGPGAGPGPGGDNGLPTLDDDGDAGAPRAEDCPTERAWVSSVRARVLAPDGSALTGAKLQLCVWTDADRVLCLAPGDTDAAGDVTVDVTDTARCMVRATARVLLPSSDRPAVYCPIEVGGADASLTVANPYVLVQATRPASDVGLAMSSVSVATLTGADVPACVAEHAPDLDALLAFTPETDVSPTDDAVLSVPNELGLDPGAHVGVWVQGGLACTRGTDPNDFVEKGEWERVATGTVDEDGERIVADDALPCLNWAGLSIE